MQFDATISLDTILLSMLAVWFLWRPSYDKVSEFVESWKTRSSDIADLRKELKAVEAKVDASNQRLARLEGIILSRESLVDALTETDSSA